VSIANTYACKNATSISKPVKATINARGAIPSGDIKILPEKNIPATKKPKYF
jgi:hypothetical protein